MINKTKLFWKYITFRRYLDKGHAEFYWIKGLITFIGIIGVYLKLYFPTIPFYFNIIFALALFLIWFLIGFVWDKLKLFHAEQEWSNKRNPTIQQIKNNVKHK